MTSSAKKTAKPLTKTQEKKQNQGKINFAFAIKGLNQEDPTYNYVYILAENGEVLYFNQESIKKQGVSSSESCGYYRIISDEELTLMVLKGKIE